MGQCLGLINWRGIDDVALLSETIGETTAGDIHGFPPKDSHVRLVETSKSR